MLDELPTEYQIFLRYPPFQGTPHNSHFELLSVLLLMLDGLPTEHHIFLGYTPFQITLHNSRFDSRGFFLYLTNLQQNTNFFLEVSALSENFAQLPF
jgi:hypothetical protein